MINSIVCKKRGEGKTTSMVELVKKNNGVLITHSEHEAQRIRQVYGLSTDQVRCCSVANLHGIDRPVYVDNVELVLRALIPGSTQISGISWTLQN